VPWPAEKRITVAGCARERFSAIFAAGLRDRDQTDHVPPSPSS
jgi:hypothetical protein